MVERLLMFSLEEEEAKELAQVISNSSCRKILNFLTDNEASEGDIVKKLKIPASTVHYNIKLLVKSKLIEVKDTLWSEKGNKVNMYRVANKLIVISPGRASEWKSKLKSFLPVIGLSFVAAGVIHLFSRSFGAMKGAGSAFPEVSKLSSGVADMVAAESFGTNVNVINVVPNYGLWFLFGALFVVLVYFLISFWRSK